MGFCYRGNRCSQGFFSLHILSLTTVESQCVSDVSLSLHPVPNTQSSLKDLSHHTDGPLSPTLIATPLSISSFTLLQNTLLFQFYLHLQFFLYTKAELVFNMSWWKKYILWCQRNTISHLYKLLRLSERLLICKVGIIAVPNSQNICDI